MGDRLPAGGNGSEDGGVSRALPGINIPSLALRDMDSEEDASTRQTRGKTFTSQPATYREKTLQDIKEGAFTPRADEPILFEKNEQGESLIIGATASSLLEHIFLQTDPNDRSSGYSWQETIDIAVLMHSYILDSPTLLRKVMRFFQTGSRLGNPTEEQKHGSRVIQVRIVNFMKQWLKTDADWTTDTHLRNLFEGELKRLEESLPDGDSLAKTLRAALPPLAAATPPYYAPNFQPHKIPVSDVSSISPLELAQQLTLIDYDYFAKIDFSKELLNRSFSKSETSPNVHKWTAHFNSVTRWVASTILQQQEKKQRAAVLGRFIKVAKHLRDFNNFNGLMQVLSGISQVCISRLKETWKLLPQKEVSLYDELLQLMTPDQNYSSARKAFQSAELPVIPFQMIVLKDLTFYEEMPDRLSNSKFEMINFAKIAQIGHMLLILTQARTFIYEFPRIGVAQDYFHHCLNDKMLPTEEMLYKMSVVFEPPALTKQPSSGYSSNDKTSFFGSLKKKSKDKDEKVISSKEDKKLKKSAETKEKELQMLQSLNARFTAGARPQSLNLKGNREIDALQFNLKNFNNETTEAASDNKEQTQTLLKELTSLRKTLTSVDLIVTGDTWNEVSKESAANGISDCLESIERMMSLLQPAAERTPLQRRRSPSNPTPPSAAVLQAAGTPADPVPKGFVLTANRPPQMPPPSPPVTQNNLPLHPQSANPMKSQPKAAIVPPQPKLTSQIHQQQQQSKLRPVPPNRQPPSQPPPSVQQQQQQQNIPPALITPSFSHFPPPSHAPPLPPQRI